MRPTPDGHLIGADLVDTNVHLERGPMRRLKLASVVLAVLVLAACPSNTKLNTLPPGALNQFDATSYTSLMGAQAVLNSVKADIDKLPPAAKPALNKAIASYNVAEAAWQAYPCWDVSTIRRL